MAAALRPGRDIGRGLLVLGVLALAGCTSMEVAMGFRTRLGDVPVSAIAASLSPGPGLAPGHSARLVIVVTTRDGKTLTTVGPGHGQVVFDSFRFDAHIVQVDEDGVVTLPSDPRLSQGQMPYLQIGVIGHPEVTAALDIPVRYDAAFDADFSGRPGHDGADGFDGFPGLPGSNGSVDAAHPSPGGDGGRGGNGNAGFAGSPGEPGEDVHVWLRLMPGPPLLLQARVAGASQEKLYLIDPQQGSLSVEANGGRGGKGGKGGRGGNGGPGGYGYPPGQQGRSGDDGYDGPQGNNGDAGRIVVSVDPAAQAYLDRLHLTNNSGGGFPGPAPQIRVEAVPPIW